jgi:hypothetical protein
LIRPVSVKVIADCEESGVYGPPVVVERLTLYPLAPELAFQVRATCALPATAERPAGADGIEVLPPAGLPDPPPAVPAQPEYRRMAQIRSERTTVGSKRTRKKAGTRAFMDLGYEGVEAATSCPEGQKKF